MRDGGARLLHHSSPALEPQHSPNSSHGQLIQASAASRGMFVDDYLRSINQFPTMERVELDHVLAAWKATANERDIEAKAAAMGMWPDQYLVYTKVF